MESDKRVQAETRCDDEEVSVLSTTRNFYAVVAAVSFALLALARAQTPTPAIVNIAAEDLPKYALKFAKPTYPYELQARGIGGKGTFLLHTRPDGTVSAVDTLISTGNAELDTAAKSALMKWRFRPGPTKVKVPITFKPPKGNT
jgi:TonB family protein